MEPRGIEPLTSALRTQGASVPTVGNKGVTSDSAAACTGACTEMPEKGHGDAPADPAAGGATSFTEALAMIARLPLSDAEKAEAVRRLLAQRAD